MKKFRSRFITLLAVLLVFLSCSSVALAKENYTYTVRFYAGTQGVFSSVDGLSVDSAEASVSQNGDKIVITGLAAGDVVSFNAQAAVSMDEDSKHYVQGVRLSGRDNDTVSASVFTVESDEDYVVAYGIKGNVTSYTVKYQDAEGNELLEDDVFYGNVGDKPVVAYKYVEGYKPQTLGFTKTLSENAADNVFVFVYDKIPDREVVVVVPGGDVEDTIGGTTGGNAGGNAGTADDTADDADEPEDDGTVADEPEDDGTVENEPADDDIVDLDDEETPLGDIDANNDGGIHIPMIGIIAILIIALVAIVNAGFFVKKSIKK